MWDMFQLQKFENNIPEGEKIRQRSTRYAWLIGFKFTKFMLFFMQLPENIIQFWKCSQKQQLKEVKRQLFHTNRWLQRGKNPPKLSNIICIQMIDEPGNIQQDMEF